MFGVPGPSPGHVVFILPSWSSWPEPYFIRVLWVSKLATKLAVSWPKDRLIEQEVTEMRKAGNFLTGGNGARRRFFIRNQEIRADCQEPKNEPGKFLPQKGAKKQRKLNWEKVGKGGEKRESMGNGTMEYWKGGMMECWKRLPPGEGIKMGSGRSRSMFAGVCCMLGRSRVVAALAHPEQDITDF